MLLSELAEKIGASEELTSRLISDYGVDVEQITDREVQDLAKLVVPAPLATQATTTKAKPVSTNAIAKATPKAEQATLTQEVRTAAQVANRREVATIEALSAPIDTVSDVLELARAKAAATLQGKKEAIVNRLSDRIVRQTEAELDGTLDFFEKFMAQGTQTALKPFQEILEGEVV